MQSLSKIKQGLFTLLILLSIPSGGHTQSIWAHLEPRTDDFDSMLERRQIRVLVAWNKLLYFVDGATQRGASYDAMEQFRQQLDKKFDLKARAMSIVYIPVERDQLIPLLQAGVADIAAANLTITPERSALVAFSTPLVRGVNEVLVTHKSAAPIRTLADLAGQTVYVRKSSSYYQNLVRLSRSRQESDSSPFKIELVDEHLEDSDLLEMVNAELLPLIVVDSHKVKFWRDVFENLRVHDEVALSKTGDIAWAMRKDNPKLKQIVDEFIRSNKQGTLIGNIILKRYFENNTWAQNALSTENLKPLRETIEYFKFYAEQYDFDWLMLAALGYQESRLNQAARSHAGAVGVMQLLPSTAGDPNVGIKNIEALENNIHAGTKYLRFIKDRYFAKDEISDLNQVLLTFASYNAGPAKISRLRKEAASMGLDPNVWFGHLEHVVAKRIGRETTQYVGNIYKYYIAYKLLLEQSLERDRAKQSLQARP